MHVRVSTASDIVRGGLMAGLAGAILIGLYLIVTIVFVLHAGTADGVLRYVATGALGKAADTAPGAAALGAVLHVAIGIAWGVGYAYIAARTPQVRARPLTSGTVFGIVVLLWMQFVEIAANIYMLPTSLELLNLFIAHTLFFGIPVALVLRRLERR